MKVLIIETNEIKELSNVITQFDDLGQSIEKTEEYNEEYDATMSLDCYEWWESVAKGIEIAEEQELDTSDFVYEDYIDLTK